MNARSFVLVANTAARDDALVVLAAVGFAVAESPETARGRTHHLAVSPRAVPVDARGLSPREFEVLRLAAEGNSNGDIGRLLGIGENAVKTHTKRLYAKLGARDRANAVLIGYRRGLLGGEA